MNLKNDGLEFDVGSDVDFEDLIADIGVNDELFALVTQEEGFENLKIRLYPRKIDELWVLKLDSIFDTLEKVKNRLWELRKIDKLEDTDV